MATGVTFDEVQYKKYRNFDNGFEIEEFIGFDTEADEHGKPFLFCASSGEFTEGGDCIADLFRHGGRRIDYAVWNLRYDSGNILRPLPLRDRLRLLEDRDIEWRGYQIIYIPHKLLRIKLGRTVRNFWDIMPFYHSSLDAAAQKYLSEKKLVLDTKKFSKAYIQKNRLKLRKYCRHDAVLTKKLADYLLKYLHKFNMHPRTLYSTASISLQYFEQQCGRIDVWRFWQRNRDLLRYAFEAYRGGKFEITSRGSFTGHEYDISAAYGYEISKLKNIRYATVYRRNDYDAGADYGFLRVEIFNPKGVHHGISYKRKNVNIYPAGRWKATITKEEYEYLLRAGIKVKLFDGWYLKLGKIEHPYRAEVMKLYKIKEEYKSKDKMVSTLAKTLVNSLYGKFVQITQQPDKSFHAGTGWNPIYGAIITANIRIRLAELQNRLGNKCVAVHTDSILTTEKMPDDFCGDKIGDWTLKESGEATVIMSGVFQVGDKCANRGFGTKKAPNWRTILEEMGTRSTLKIDQTRVLSWNGQTKLGKDENVNLFLETEKVFDVNKEAKRIWPDRTNGTKLLTRLEHSAPPVVMEV